MANQYKKHLPHLLVRNTASPSSYTRPSKKIDSPSGIPQRSRQAHAQHLLTQLETIEQQVATDEVNNGVYLSFEVEVSFEFHFQNLEYQTSGIELCSVKEVNGKTIATVFVPDGKLPHFFKKITQYQNEETKSGKQPKNNTLVASISEIKLAALEALWTDTLAFPETEQAIWWEVWLRRSNKKDYKQLLQQHSQHLDIRVSEESIDFLDRTVVLVYATKQQLSQSIYVLGIIAELRAAKDKADFYTAMNALEQSAWINETIQRLQIPSDNCPRVCILDTGVNALHPLLQPVTNMSDMHSYNPAWGTDDRQGHGTNMAGLAIYGDLTSALSDTQTIVLTHRLESVKILPNNGNNDKHLYGAITVESVARVEIQNPKATRLFCMAVTAPDGDRDRGRPSSWSASIDAIASGYYDEQQRLIIISAGNTDNKQRHLYPNSNVTDQVHDPGQAWNALTVGAYTEKVFLNQEHSDAGWKAIAEFGDLSPASCTSMTWDKAWPIKPDIVMEGGNQALSPHDGTADYIDEGLQLLTTGHQITTKPLVSFGDTSAATAIASQLAARVQAAYPEFWAETVRALLIHSAEWTPAMKARFSPFKTKEKYRQLLRYCGYGVPNETKLFWSASNALTLIAQDSLQPYVKEKGSSTVKTNQLNLHKLPWPIDVLQSLPPATQVEMKVTLSYFIEPNPSSRGHNHKYLYASHGLRFEVRRPLESLDNFQQRINKQARDEENRHSTVSDDGWILGSNLRSLGSVHSDIWQGSASALAERGYIAVYPVSGWWKERPNLERWHKQARYALIVSITTPNIETDIYTAVTNQIQVNVDI